LTSFSLLLSRYSCFIQTTPKKSPDYSAASAAKQSLSKNSPLETSLRGPIVDEDTPSKDTQSSVVKPATGGSQSTSSKVVDMFADDSDEEDLFSLSSKSKKIVDKVSKTNFSTL